MSETGRAARVPYSFGSARVFNYARRVGLALECSHVVGAFLVETIISRPFPAAREIKPGVVETRESVLRQITSIPTAAGK